MALTHATATRNAIADLIDTLVNTGSGSNGQIVIKDSGSTTLATINLADPAFGAAASGVITLQSVPVTDTSADATGTAATFSLLDKDGTTILSGTVTATGGGGDMELVSTSITSGQPVQITSLTYTASA